MTEHDEPRDELAVVTEHDWTPAFEGQRPPFAPGNEHRVGEGNQLAVRHGASALLRLRPRSLELASALRGVMVELNVWDDGYQPALEMAALVGAQAEAAFAALADCEPTELRWLDERARAWARTYTDLLGKLGLTPVTLARLSVDSNRAARLKLRAHLEQEYRGGES